MIYGSRCGGRVADKARGEAECFITQLDPHSRNELTFKFAISVDHTGHNLHFKRRKRGIAQHPPPVVGALVAALRIE